MATAAWKRPGSPIGRTGQEGLTLSISAMPANRGIPMKSAN
jgi:hypothetical protein